MRVKTCALLVGNRRLLLEVATPEKRNQLFRQALRIHEILMAFFNRYGITQVDYQLDAPKLGTQQKNEPLSSPIPNPGVPSPSFQISVSKSLKLFTDNGQWTKNKKRIAKQDALASFADLQ